MKRVFIVCAIWGLALSWGGQWHSTSVKTWWMDDTGILDSTALFTGHTSVLLQNGSNNDHHDVVSASSHSTRGFLVFSTVLTLRQTWIVLQSNLIMRHHTLPATIHKFLLMNNCTKFQFWWTLLWSSTVLYSNLKQFHHQFKRFYAENKHNLLHLKYTNEESKVWLLTSTSLPT